MDDLISVIVPTFRDWTRLATCLAALGRQTLAADRFEVIVANNDAADPAPPFALAANVRVVVEGKPGSYAARNAAVRAARGAFLAFTDSDCVPDPDWLERGLAALHAAPDARISGAVPLFREPRSGAVAYLYEYHTAFRQRDYAARGEGATANLMVAADTFARIGPFDEELLSGGDFAWHRRAQAMGVPIVYHDEVVVRHPARRALREIFAKRRRTARSEAVFHDVKLWHYAKYRIKPPFGRLSFDRGTIGPAGKATLFCVQWAINLYAVSQFALVRAKLGKPVRS